MKEKKKKGKTSTPLGIKKNGDSGTFVPSRQNIGRNERKHTLLKRLSDAKWKPGIHTEDS